MSANKAVYDLEDVRTFVARRPWFHGSDDCSLVSEQEYENLMARLPPQIPETRINHIRSFMKGWLAAKG